MTISIITATYNSSQTLRDTINSVLNQTYKDIEYIIVDAVSKDDTINIIKEYEPLFNDKMKWVSEPDNGIYDAMNKGIKMATGDVVGILNSDDFFTSDDVLENIAKEFIDDIDATYGDVHFVKEENIKKCVRYYSGRIFSPGMLKFGFIAPHPSFYIRKSIYDKYGLYKPELTIAADFELVARLCHKHKIRTKYVHQDVVTMRIGGASTKNLHNMKIGLENTITACKQLGIKTNWLFVRLKYIIKLVESLILTK